MTSIDNVQDISPRAQYTASVSQTAFTYPFPIFADADLTVDVDGTAQTLTTDYTVSGAGDETGGTVTFLVAMSGAEVVTIYRDISIERDTDVQQNGPWSSTSYNDELDKVMLVLQELEERVSRCLRVPTTAANVDGELTPFSTYLSKFVGFDASGVVTPKTVTSGVATDADQINLADAGGNYAAAEVEAALAELGGQASLTSVGVVELATSAELDAGTDVIRPTAPDQVKASARLGWASGSFTATVTGFSSDPSALTVNWSRSGNLVTVVLNINNNTSNSANFTITNVPAAIQSNIIQTIQLAGAIDNSSNVTASIQIGTAAVWTFGEGTANPAGGGFTASGGKGFQGSIGVGFTYMLDGTV